MKLRIVLLLAIVTAASAALLVRRAEPKRAAMRLQRPSTTWELPAPSPALVTVASNIAGDERIEPHPMTPERALLADENALLLAVESALERRDVDGARLLLRQHEQRFPQIEGGAEDREGFEAIATCIENPGAESRASGERFIAEHRASPLRRKVRHACLGPRAPALLR